MDGANPRSTAKIAGHPIHPMLVGFPITFFVSTLLTDLAFAKTAYPLWAAASSWLLGAGLVMAGLAALAGLTDFLGDRRIREKRPAWMHMIANVVAVLLSALNLIVHIRDGYDAVVPWGVTLSAIVVLILLFSGWQGWELVYRGKVGVADD